jgi:hypothetical protein
MVNMSPILYVEPIKHSLVPFYPLPFYVITFSVVNSDTSLWLCNAKPQSLPKSQIVVAGHFSAWRNHRLLFILLLSTPAHILAPSHDVALVVAAVQHP